VERNALAKKSVTEICGGDTTIGWILSEGENMNVTADQRRCVLKLFNISEAARQLGWPVQDTFRRIRSGQLPSPQISLGRRFYFSADDLQVLRQKSPQENDHR
jgi:hypothetical protein